MIRVTIYLDADETEVRSACAKGGWLEPRGEGRRSYQFTECEVGPADTPGGYTEGTRGGAAFDQDMEA